MWQTSFFQAAGKQLDGVEQEVVFDACMHGGRRDKSTKLLYRNLPFGFLTAKCDGSHAHLPWSASRVDGVWTFATSEDRRYPLELCDKIAREVHAEWPAVFPASRHSSFQPLRKSIHAATSMKHPRRGLSSLVPEFVSTSSVMVRSSVTDKAQAEKALRQERGMMLSCWIFYYTEGW